MAIARGQTPPGPQDDYQPDDDLLEWMGHQFKKFGDIYHASIYGTTAYVIRDPDFANHVLVENSQNYVKGQLIKRVALLLGNGLMVSEGEFWKRQRQMIQPVFDRKAIDALTKLSATVNSALLQKWKLAAHRNEQINLTRDVMGATLEVGLRSILGDDYDQIGGRFSLLASEPARDLAFVQEFRSLRKIMRELIDRRRKMPSTANDILGGLMQARDPLSGAFMPEHQLIDEVLTLVVAGHETTASTLNWTWYLISQHPEVEGRLSIELQSLTDSPEFEDLPHFSYTRQIIDESMRLYPPGWLMTRKALKNDRLGDYFVPAGTEIYISPYFIQRHPALWKNPDRFDPDRFAPENSKDRHRLAMIPFSAGPRNCIGALFARVEMQIHLMMIAKRLRLRYVQSSPLELDAKVNLRSKHDFVMRPELKTVGNR